MSQVLFFSEIRERLQCAHCVNPGAATVGELIDLLAERNGPLWGNILRCENVLIAVNHTLCDESKVLQASDEVAFFPPVTGG